jgi:hypothetical protein
MPAVGLRNVFLLTVGVALLIPAAASASFHLIKVSEVYPGSAADPDAQFIELQMYASGQNLVSGHTVTASGPGGDEGYTFATNVPKGQSQRTILLASPEAEAAFGVSADLEISKLALDPTGGAVCFESIDCVAWGSAAGALPSPAGTNAAAIPNGMSLRRSIQPGCETLLESADDSNDSATDFSAAAPSPRNNATAPTETKCDTKVRGASLSAKSKQDTSASRPKIGVEVGLGEEGEVKVVAKAKVGKKTYKLTKSTSLRAGKAKGLELKAKGKSKRKIGKALKQGRKVTVKLAGKFSDEAGNKATKKARTTLK